MFSKNKSIGWIEKPETNVPPSLQGSTVLANEWRRFFENSHWWDFKFGPGVGGLLCWIPLIGEPISIFCTTVSVSRAHTRFMEQINLCMKNGEPDQASQWHSTRKQHQRGYAFALGLRGGKRFVAGQFPVAGDLLVGMNSSYKLSTILREDILKLMKKWQLLKDGLATGRDFNPVEALKFPKRPKRAKTAAGKPPYNNGWYSGQTSSRDPSPIRKPGNARTRR